MEENLTPEELIFLQDLSSPEAQKRLTAAQCLSGTRARLVVPPLIKLLADEDHEVRSAARFALYEIGIKTEVEFAVIRELLEHREADVKLSVFQCIAWLDGNEHFVRFISPVVIQLLENQDSAVCAEAAQFLIWVEDGLLRKWFESKGGGIDLAHALSLSSDETRRVEGLVALADYGLREHKQDIAHPCRAIRLAIAIALARLGKKPRHIEDELEWKGSLGKTIASILLNNSARQQYLSNEVVYQTNDSLLKDLLLLLQDSASDVREVAVVGLQQIADPRSIKALEELLLDPDARVRVHVLLALGKIGSLDNTTIRSLARSLQDPIVQVRRAASRALRMIGIQAGSVLQEVLDKLKDEDTQVRQTLVELLAVIQPKSIEVVYRLLEVLEGADSSTCMLIKMALITILPNTILSEEPNILEDRLLALPNEPQAIYNETCKYLR